MANSTPSTSAHNNETSVLFNLQELMRIEQERVLAEAAAERAAHEAMERQRTERERRLADEVARAQREEAQAQRERELARERSVIESDTARATALLKVQLEMEANERAERQRRELEHARALSLIGAERQGRGSGRALAWLLIGTLLVAALGYFGVLSPLLRDSRAREVEALELALQHARELSALREQAAQPLPVLDSPAAAVAEPVEVSVPARVEKTPRKGMGRTKVARHHVTTETVDVLDSEDEDPLIGL